MLPQLDLCFPVLFTLVLYTDTVRGDIGVNCGPGAVVGQPYNLECNNIPTNVTIGINVFLEGESNSIVFCDEFKDCAVRNGLLYSVVSPHTTSLSFTILNVTTDDIGKKLYCVDDTTLDLSTPKPNCELLRPTTVPPTTSTSSTTSVGSTDSAAPETTSRTTSDGNTDSVSTTTMIVSINDGDDGLSDGAIAGITIGCICVVVIVTTVGVMAKKKVACFSKTT